MSGRCEWRAHRVPLGVATPAGKAGRCASLRPGAAPGRCSVTGGRQRRPGAPGRRGMRGLPPRRAPCPERVSPTCRGEGTVPGDGHGPSRVTRRPRLNRALDRPLGMGGVRGAVALSTENVARFALVCRRHHLEGCESRIGAGPRPLRLRGSPLRRPTTSAPHSTDRWRRPAVAGRTSAGITVPRRAPGGACARYEGSSRHLCSRALGLRSCPLVPAPLRCDAPCTPCPATRRARADGVPPGIPRFREPADRPACELPHTHGSAHAHSRRARTGRNFRSANDATPGAPSVFVRTFVFLRHLFACKGS